MKAFKHFFKAGILAILACMVAFMLSAQTSKTLNELYVFGDSLSDMGTVFRATGGSYPPHPTYFQGRYSNGQVWVEYLATRLKISSDRVTNFACGGATTGRDRNTPVPSLLTQVESFTSPAKQVNPNALYVLWAGANDYLQGINDATIPVENITQAMAALVKVGAKNILVANLPDLGKLPATLNQTNANQLTALTQSHNQGLRRSVKVLAQQYSNLAIATLDANVLYGEAIANPGKFGLTNVKTACLSTRGICKSPEQFLFWDGIHPTTVAHKILGEAALGVLQDTGIVTSQLEARF